MEVAISDCGALDFRLNHHLNSLKTGRNTIWVIKVILSNEGIQKNPPKGPKPRDVSLSSREGSRPPYHLCKEDLHGQVKCEGGSNRHPAIRASQ
jgi:hypothetical protein